MHLLRRHYRAIIIVLLVPVTFCIAVPVYMRIAMDPYIYSSLDQVPKSQVALVLGASVSHGTPSPILEERTDTAIKLYLAGKVSKILVTGDNGELTHDEVTPVRKYLTDAGIPAADIFLDHAGFDTYSSMYRTRDIFEADSIIIVTQDFHLPRSLFIARHLGMQAYGVIAEGTDTSIFDYVREIPASDKALLDLWVLRKPKYLGAQIPLSGDGSTTWY